MGIEFCAELSGVRKRFGKTVALDGLDLQVRPSELFSVLGPNGAGKSTAISLLLGLLKPDTGAARLFGLSPFRIEPRRQISRSGWRTTSASRRRWRAWWMSSISAPGPRTAMTPGR